MKKWLTPTAIEDKFIPNEAISTCYAVACNWEDANTYERGRGIEGKYGNAYDRVSGEWVGKVLHSKDGCGTYSKQTLTVKNGMLTNIKEGGLDGHLYQDSNYITEVPGLSINDGTKIYWTTTSGNRTWHHQGKIIKAVDSKSIS